MAINPAPMDQCDRKCRCNTGPNQGQAYSCNQPCLPGYQFVKEGCDCYPAGDVCPYGVDGVLTSTLTVGGLSQTATTFIPALKGGIANGAARVIDGSIQVFNGSNFVDAGRSPFVVGDDYNGQPITDVIDKLELAGECTDDICPVECATVLQFERDDENGGRELVGSTSEWFGYTGTGGQAVVSFDSGLGLYTAKFFGNAVNEAEKNAGVEPYYRELLFFPGAQTLETDNWQAVVVSKDTGGACINC